MNVLGKITKTEWLLIALTALFLCLLLLLTPKAEQDSGIFTLTVSRASPEPVTPQAPELIDLNAATAEELETLSGIGPVMARRIIEYRNAHGPFERIEDLMNVDGIGTATLKKFRDHVTVG